MLSRDSFRGGTALKYLTRPAASWAWSSSAFFTLPPKFDLYRGATQIGSLKKEFSLFRHRYNLDCNGWHVEGNWLGWDYSIVDGSGRTAATISRSFLNWTDTYVIDVVNPQDALSALMVVLAIDAEKCSAGS